jgi:Matrixin
MSLFRSSFSKPVWVAAASIVALVAHTSPAQAYCLLHTCKDVSEADAALSMSLEPYTCERTDGCISEGHQLYWDSNCLTFGVSPVNASVLGMEPEEFRDIIEDAFKVWEGLDCGGGKHPGLSVVGVGLVDANGGFFCEAEPYANLSVWSLITRWDRPDNALGYTSSTHNRKNGEVFDADVELNLNKIRLDHENRPADYPIVVGRIAVHEAGHFLGLAHSEDQDAVMYASYDSNDLFTREVNQDDIDGICALYPPRDVDCSEPGYVEAALNEEACEAAAAANESEEEAGCTVSPRGATSASWGWLGAPLFIGSAMVRRRRTARRK